MALTHLRPLFGASYKRKTLQQLVLGTSPVVVKPLSTISGREEPGKGKVGHLHYQKMPVGGSRVAYSDYKVTIICESLSDLSDSKFSLN